MKLFTYRNRQRLRRGGVVFAVVLGILCLGIVVSFAYLERYMVYTGDQAVMVLPGEEPPELPGDDPPTDYFVSEIPEITLETMAPQPRPDSETGETAGTAAPAEEGEQALAISGYYVTYEDLKNPVDTLAAIQADADCTTVLVELKSCYGTCYYSSRLSGAQTSESLNVSAVDSFISQLAGENYHLIALVPAYCDSVYALAHQSEGLPISGGALWLDWDSYYWLDPASETVQTHLVEECTELYGLGFDEIAFSHFTFPVSDNIVYDGDRGEALTQAADLLTKTAGLLDIPVSFCDPSLQRPILTPGTDGHLLFFPEDASLVSEVLSWLGAAETTAPTAAPEDGSEPGSASGEAPPSIEGVTGDTPTEDTALPADTPAGEPTSPDPDGDLTDSLVFCTGSHDTRFGDYAILRPVNTAA